MFLVVCFLRLRLVFLIDLVGLIVVYGRKSRVVVFGVVCLFGFVLLLVVVCFVILLLLVVLRVVLLFCVFFFVHLGS